MALSVWLLLHFHISALHTSEMIQPLLEFQIKWLTEWTYWWSSGPPLLLLMVEHLDSSPMPQVDRQSVVLDPQRHPPSFLLSWLQQHTDRSTVIGMNCTFFSMHMHPVPMDLHFPQWAVLPPWWITLWSPQRWRDDGSYLSKKVCPKKVKWRSAAKEKSNHDIFPRALRRTISTLGGHSPDCSS